LRSERPLSEPHRLSAVAAAVTGLNVRSLNTATKLDLADSALHAPSAGFGRQDLYPDFVDKAAVLLVRLAKNHPLLDGNKRAAWVTLRLFIDMNGWSWNPYPSIDEAERAVLSVASGEWNDSARLSGCERISCHLTH
jgi:death on curing protein